MGEKIKQNKKSLKFHQKEGFLSCKSGPAWARTMDSLIMSQVL